MTHTLPSRGPLGEHASPLDEQPDWRYQLLDAPGYKVGSDLGLHPVSNLADEGLLLGILVYLRCLLRPTRLPRAAESRAAG